MATLVRNKENTFGVDQLQGFVLSNL